MDGHLEMPDETKISVTIHKAINGYVLQEFDGSNGKTFIAPSFADAIEIMAQWMGERS